MKRLIIAAIVLLSGCANIKELIPSKWDDNQGKVIVDIRQTTTNFDCTGDQQAQLAVLNKQVQWFELYTESKGTADIANLNAIFSKTVKEYQDKVNAGPVSPMYCNLKKKIMVEQADIMAKTVLGRF